MTMLAGVGETTTDSALDVMVEPVALGMVAVIVAVPIPTIATKPVGLTVATVGALESHAVGWAPGIATPALSFTTAVACTVFVT